ncbi:MAG TPA: hypothetical protein DEE98_00450 [Elusimicrobia bacterium]|nr:MAG: hypothetical protein A2278_03080 [Elusimicrobia bacterium RIFOXYA12_FULL_49_49]OGS08417.1 MAG: hypothetical protein A2204_08230 [Elusimicrobia bacterium RIFOXYA1_FULL_47_7]OGS09661.1 MAG: hypothetical protein A2386_01140 [Elusimicrobia bacterium RIFOXYB1_FULL_48_9]OGS15548.1 MAG: hypothetical protein A2251_03330 [Elusimicrobia bacterium RIFOXYA2_FULL_47_53]OGS26896.1 MAG: hypothetical protein A2339_07650 [Elusimicrobia bacterium RIFOXYB12_FULL_50_12]OGS30647.1 MAG: hypothetical protein
MVNFLRNKAILNFYEAIYPYLKTSLHVESELPGRKAMVFAPHADDEAIGCGGTILKHNLSGGESFCVYMTDDGPQRRAEAAKAAELLKFHKVENFGYGVETLSSAGDLHERLAGILNRENPEVVFVPFVLDNHSDHRALNSALFKASDMIAGNPMVYAYPVWSPLYPNLLVDIEEVWDAKKAAIECYKSQTATRDYVSMAYSLSKYWSTVKGGGLKLAENFFRMSLKKYAELGRKLGA